MKRTAFFVLLLVMNFTLSCQEKKVNDVKIGFVIDFLDADRWYKDKQYFTNAIDSLGGECIFEHAGGNIDEQISICRKLIETGVDVLVIVPSNANKLTEVVKEAHEAGIKVIAYDRMIYNCDLDYYISFDPINIGIKQAEFTVERVPKGNYVLLQGPATDDNAVKMRQGHEKVLNDFIERGDINVVFDYQAEAWTMMDVYLAFSEFLSQNPDIKIDAVIASTDIQSEAVVTAFTDFEMEKDAIITGQDAALNSCRLIIEGQQTMTIYKSIKYLAETAAEFAMKVAKDSENIEVKTTVNNGFKDVPAVLVDVKIVTAENMEETVIKDGYWSKEQLDMR